MPNMSIVTCFWQIEQMERRRGLRCFDTEVRKRRFDERSDSERRIRPVGMLRKRDEWPPVESGEDGESSCSMKID